MVRTWYSALKELNDKFVADLCMTNGAAIAYYAVFSVPPLLAIVFSVVSYAGVSDEAVQQVLERQLGIAPPAVAHWSPNAPSDAAVTPAGRESANPPAARRDAPDAIARIRAALGLGLWRRAVELAILLFTATGLFAQLQYALNRIWEFEPDPRQGGVRRFLVKRVLSLGLILVMAFLLLVSLVVSTLIDEILIALQGTAPDYAARAVGFALNNLATIALATVIFAAMFKILPDGEMRWRDTWLGAAITACLFVAGKSLIAWYLRQLTPGANWGGAATSLAAVLAWFYYTSLIVLFGAELTQFWARRIGGGIRPASGAVRTIEVKQRLPETN